MPRPCWWYTCEFCSGRIYGPRVYTHENCVSYVNLRTHRLTPLASRLTFEEARQNLRENNAAVESAARQKEHAVLEEAAKKGAGSRCLEIERAEKRRTTPRKQRKERNRNTQIWKRLVRSSRKGKGGKMAVRQCGEVPASLASIFQRTAADVLPVPFPETPPSIAGPATIVPATFYPRVLLQLWIM